MKEILESHPVSSLRKEVSKVNKEIKGKNPFLGAYKLPKPQLISLMLKHKDKFKHIKMKKKEKVKRVDKSILKDIEKKDISEKVKKTKKEKPKEIPISFKEYQEMKQKSKVLNFLTDVEYARSNIPLQVKRTKDVKPKVSKKLSKKEITKLKLDYQRKTRENEIDEMIIKEDTGLDNISHASKVDYSFISITRLARRKADFECRTWIMDSGAFSQVLKQGIIL